MKFLIVFLAFAMIASAFALPAGLEQQQLQQQEQQQQQQEQQHAVLSRVRRVTCDLLSPSTPIGSINHAACAAHCLAMFKGFRGGRCMDGVCNCRR